jgi:hypothetical protein
VDDVEDVDATDDAGEVRAGNTALESLCFMSEAFRVASRYSKEVIPIFLACFLSSFIFFWAAFASALAAALACFLASLAAFAPTIGPLVVDNGGGGGAFDSEWENMNTCQQKFQRRYNLKKIFEPCHVRIGTGGNGALGGPPGGAGGLLFDGNGGPGLPLPGGAIGGGAPDSERK